MSKRLKNPESMHPKDVLDYHVSGAVERGEATPIVDDSLRLV